MNIKFFSTSVFTFTAIAASVVLSSGCAAQATQTRVAATQGSATRQAEAITAQPKLPDPAQVVEKAPRVFRAQFVTTKGNFTVEVTRAWAPNAADRFYNMCRLGYYQDTAIFRSIKDFMFQFGIHGDPKVTAKWIDATIKDDPPIAGISNLPGTLSFAQTSNPNSRSVQIFVNTGKNDFLDKGRTPFVPFGKIVEGMDVIPKIFVTGENKPEDNVQGNFQRHGNDYIKRQYPNVDFIRSVKISVTN